jgi:hypothetical protein
MTDTELSGARPVRHLAATRRLVSVDPAGVVDAEPFGADRTAPLVFRPRTTVDLAEWLRLSRDRVEEQLLRYGVDRAMTSVTDQAELPLNAEYGDGTPMVSMGGTVRMDQVGRA